MMHAASVTPDASLGIGPAVLDTPICDVLHLQPCGLYFRQLETVYCLNGLRSHFEGFETTNQNAQ